MSTISSTDQATCGQSGDHRPSYDGLAKRKLKPLILVGAGGHAASCIDVIEQEGQYLVGGLVGSNSEVSKNLLGYPMVGTDEDLAMLVAQYPRALVGVGQIKTPEPRIRLFAQLRRIGYDMPPIVSPQAYISRHATLGMGTIVMHGAIVNAGAIVGNNCIINSQSIVEHDAVIDDHCHISIAVVINGGARIGEGTFVGSGSIVRESITVGKHCLIGMGQRILADCEAGSRVPDRNL